MTAFVLATSQGISIDPNPNPNPSLQLITFPECLERLFDDCMAIVRRDLKDLGLTSIEVVTHKKRNSD